MTELLPRRRYTEYNGFPVRFPERSPETVGLAPEVPPLRRTADGRIDYEYYLQRASVERSRVVYALLASIGRGLAALMRGLVGRRRRSGRPQAD